MVQGTQPGDVRGETAIAWHQFAFKMHGWESNKVCPGQEHPKISKKAIYGNGYGVSTIMIETILLETLSSTSPTYMKYAKMRKIVPRTTVCTVRDLIATS